MEMDVNWHASSEVKRMWLYIAIATGLDPGWVQGVRTPPFHIRGDENLKIVLPVL